MTSFAETLREVGAHYDDSIGINRLCTTYRLLARTYRQGRILDVGTWPGDFAVCLKRLGYDVVGVDIDPSRAAASFQREGLVVHQADIEQHPMPFADGQIPYIVFTEVIEHLYVNPLHTLAELRRVLSPGGRMLISTPNLSRWENRMLFALGQPLILVETPYDAFRKKQAVGHMGHLRLFTPEELRDLLAKTGFRTVEEHFVDLEQPGASEAVSPPAVDDRRPAAPRGFFSRLFRRRSAREWVEALGVKGAPVVKHLMPELRGHLFLLVEKA